MHAALSAIVSGRDSPCRLTDKLTPKGGLVCAEAIFSLYPYLYIYIISLLEVTFEPVDQSILIELVLFPRDRH
jgi:hypothetical protein